MHALSNNYKTGCFVPSTAPRLLPVGGGGLAKYNTKCFSLMRVFPITTKGAVLYCKLQHQNHYLYGVVTLYCKIQHQMLLPDARLANNYERGCSVS